MPLLHYASGHALGGGYRDQIFYHPTSATTLPFEGDLVVTDSWTHRLQFITPHGRVRQTFGSFGTERGQLWQPNGLVANNFSVFIVDTGNHRVQKLRLNNMSVSRVLGSYGSGPAQFRFPLGATLVNGTLYVSDSNNHRISMFWSFSMRSRGSFGSQGIAPGQLSFPEGITGYNGEIFVADTGNDRISVFDTTGSFLRAFGGEGEAPGQFLLPTGVIAFQSRLYVTEFYGKRVQELTTNGDALGTVPMGNVGGLSGLCATVRRPDDTQPSSLYIVDAEFHVVHVLNVKETGSSSKRRSRSRGMRSNSHQLKTPTHQTTASSRLQSFLDGSSHLPTPPTTAQPAEASSRLQSFLDSTVAPMKSHKSRTRPLLKTANR